MIALLKFAICDDEPLIIQEISSLISNYMQENQLISYQIFRFFNGYSLLEYLKKGENFDLIFLDIRMKEYPDGMETAKILRRNHHQNLLIFITVLKDYVFDAFEIEAYDYLLKPLDIARFQRTMDRAIKFLQQQKNNYFAIQKGNVLEILSFSQIVYCEVQGRKIYIHKSDTKTLDYYYKLEDFQRQVDERFFRCHRSYLVNLDYVRGCQNGRVKLESGDEIPVSRLREHDFMQALLRHIKNKNI